jgi:hypothetical protein
MEADNVSSYSKTWHSLDLNSPAIVEFISWLKSISKPMSMFVITHYLVSQGGKYTISQFLARYSQAF